MWTFATIQLLAAARLAPPELDRLTLFGFVAMCVSVVCLGIGRRSRGARLILAISLGAHAIYGFAAGAWPLGILALVAMALAVKWWRGRRTIEVDVDSDSPTVPTERWIANLYSRRSRLFGVDARSANNN